MDSSSSERLTLLRFPLIVGVVFIHAANGSGLALTSAARAARPVESAISFGFAAVAVPLFFLISGYLFFQTSGAGALPDDGKPVPLQPAEYARKLKGRARTLLVPYLFWNVLLGLAYFVAAKIPVLAGLTSGSQVAFVSESPLGWLSAILGIGRAPVVYQFWFIRNLMLAVLLVPLFEGLFRLAGKRPSLLIGAMLLGGPWLLHSWPLEVPNAVSLFFFFCGAWIARFRAPLFRFDALTVPIGFLWAAAVFACTAGLTGNTYPLLLQISILLGIVFVLGATNRWPVAQNGGEGAMRRALIRWAPAAFFLFAVHEPLLTVLIRLSTRALAKLGASGLEAFVPALQGAVYFGSVAATCVLSVALHRWARSLAPRLTALATGGR